MAKCILAIDQGTTGTTACIFAEDGTLVSKVNQEFPQIYPKPGWVEHDPEEIWNSVRLSVKKVLQKMEAESELRIKDIAGIGITNQRETTVLWDRKSSKPVHNAIVWQCRRTSDFCKKHQDDESWLRRKTGLVMDPYFSATKLYWLFQHNKSWKKQAQKAEILFGTIDSFLLWRLTGGQVHATDVTNASRTALMNLKKVMWDEQLLEYFELPQEILPEILPSSYAFGVTQGLDFLPDGIPISGIAGDQQAALFGQACFKQGDAKCTFGTGSFLLMNTGKNLIRSKKGMLTTVAWQLGVEKDVTYALEGSAFICGAAVQFLRDNMQFVKTAPEIEELAKQVADSGEVEFVPAFAGLGAPYWDPEARGAILGMTRGTQRAHIARACLDGMALQNADLLIAMQKDANRSLRQLKVDGGASSNNLLMQIQADILGCKVVRPKVIETTASGAAFLSGLAVGLWENQKQIQEIWDTDEIFSSHWKNKQRKERLQSWHLAIEKISLKKKKK